jgi:myo-inositol 2-dehydrogenase/D-chiro-inositol 1-dehydrogenase
MKAIRLGFTGMGHIPVHAHLPGLAPLVESGDVVLQAFCDLNVEAAQEQAKAFGAKAVYGSHAEMLEKEALDAVYICLPPTLHKDEITSAIDKGIHVFVEKPVSLDMGQAVRFSQAIEKAGVVSQVGFMSRYYPSAEIVKELLEKRQPRHAQILKFYSGKHIRYWTSRYELCGGSFVENTIHTVDLLRYFLGDIAKVSAFYFERQPGEGPEPINMPHVYGVNYCFASGVVGNATTSRVLTNVKTSRSEVLIISDDSLIEWSTDEVVENGESVWKAADGAYRSAFGLQAKAFIEAVRAEDPQRMRSPYGPSLNSLAATLGANASAADGGRVIDLQDFASGH